MIETIFEIGIKYRAHRTITKLSENTGKNKKKMIIKNNKRVISKKNEWTTKKISEKSCFTNVNWEKMKNIKSIA